MKPNEKERWDQLTPEFMSEESDGEDDDGSSHFVIHKPEWRSGGTYWALYILGLERIFEYSVYLNGSQHSN